ncbi:hypothetical protein EVAR_5693_1 [Eumeta japonica]|uniref:Uncharacterized protein n=1 Tax=Eumeta variegata TaxID=151549 RepID=A0A4C1T7B0_EUMVA|nr:hypothetical protein EVAR_5693_1 [Eumeta japonica]
MVENERADELIKTALRFDTPPDYDHDPLSYAKKMIRNESLVKCQDRYNSENTEEATRWFFLNAEAFCIVRSSKLTPTKLQILTGHPEIASYLLESYSASKPKETVVSCTVPPLKRTRSGKPSSHYPRQMSREKRRIIRIKNKTIMLFSWEEEHPYLRFALSYVCCGHLWRTRTGEVVDRLECIKASEIDEVVVHEDRATYSLRQEAELKTRAYKEKSKSQRHVLGVLGRATKRFPGKKPARSKYIRNGEEETKSTNRARKGDIHSPAPVPIKQL